MAMKFRIIIPAVDYHLHAAERSTRLDFKPMRAIGFAPWNGFPCLDDPNQDSESFAEQRQRLQAAMRLPEDICEM